MDELERAASHQVTFHHKGVYYRAVVTGDWLRRRGGGYGGLAKIHEGIPTSAIRWFQTRGLLTEITKELAMRLLPDPETIKALQEKPTKWPKRLPKGMVRIHVVVSKQHKKEIQKIAGESKRPSQGRLVRQWIAEGIARHLQKEGVSV